MEWSRTEITSLSDSALRNVAVHFAETIEDFQQTIREQAEQLTARDEEVERLAVCGLLKTVREDGVEPSP